MCRPVKQWELLARCAAASSCATVVLCRCCRSIWAHGCCFFFFVCFHVSARMQGSSWGSFTRQKPGRCFVRWVPSRKTEPDRLLAVSELRNEPQNKCPRLAVLPRAQLVSGINPFHAYFSSSRCPLHLHAGVQGEALWEEVRVVPDRVVRGQLVQDQRPGHQLHCGEHDGGRWGSRDHRDRHAEPRDRPRRLQHGGNLGTKQNKTLQHLPWLRY